ncbi:MAG: DUF4382 domain-containing protein [Nitrososphaerales archaeon]
MSISRKSMMGGIVGVIVAIGLIVAGMYAFGGGSFLGSTHSSTSLISTATSGSGSVTGVSSNTGVSTTAVGSSSGSSTTSGSGSSGSTGTLQISMIDPPHVPANVVDVYVNYSSIQVHVANAGNQSGWYNVTSSGTINLMKIVSSSKVLGSATLPSGTYNIVRFNVTSAVVTVNSTSGVLTNHTANVPSGMVQATITGGVNVQANTPSALLIDISPRVTGANGSYTLVPSATAQPQTPVGTGSTTTVTQSSHTSTSVSTTSHTT